MDCRDIVMIYLILYCLNSKFLKLPEMIQHSFALFRRMILPIRNFARYPKWKLVAVRFCWIARELLISQIGIVFKSTCRLCYIKFTDLF